MSEFCHQINFDGTELYARPDTLSYMLACGTRLISITSLYLNSLSPSLTVTTVLKAGLYSMGCPDVQRSMAGCGNPPFSKAVQLVQQCVGKADSLNSLIRVSANLAMYISEHPA